MKPDLNKALESFKDMSEFEKEMYLISLREEVREKVYSNKYLTSPDGDTILYAKQIARKNKIKFQDILKGMRPSGALNTTVWDETGKLVPYKRIFY